jgi:hypothetical protein
LASKKATILTSRPPKTPMPNTNAKKKFIKSKIRKIAAQT